MQEEAEPTVQKFSAESFWLLFAEKSNLPERHRAEKNPNTINKKISPFRFASAEMTETHFQITEFSNYPIPLVTRY